jgi:acyl-CoA dehydrogenase
MTFVPPLQSLMQALRMAGKLEQNLALSDADAEAIITEAGRFASEVLAPLNRVGDLNGVTLAHGEVTTPPGWPEAYQKWCDAGWSSVNGPEAYGGQELPMVMSVACTELWNSANLAFAVGPLLTNGAIEAIAAHASDDLKARYLPNMITGKWSGTMNLTEPQSGSDLSELRCRAEQAPDGSYKISGTKIYITYGEHDCTENIIHLVLARLEGAPPGAKGITLFIVPKILPDGTRNDLFCSGIEHKLGMHGAPTCTMIYGSNGGAVGWRVGEENRGLNCMFTMMNNARLLVGVQGVGIAERATQMALTFANERRQGRAPGRNHGQSAINEHPDVLRMLLDMQSRTMAARMLCMATAAAMDEAKLANDDAQREMANARAALLTPLAKAYSTDIAVEVASLCVQIHGGMGYIEETGAAQLLRDARILPIYEGTNGIQAADLVIRKIRLDRGAAALALRQDCRNLIKDVLQQADLHEAAIKVQSLLATVATHTEMIVNGDLSFALMHSTSYLRALSATVASAYLLRATREHGTDQQAELCKHIALYFLHTNAAGDVAHLTASLDMPAHVVSPVVSN